ncbi:MAG: helix-turn-helix transcriptional regulator [Clostridia bacterium]|nr:helix-turn-helix transcriptional regulator [Clostridia bacterium]
MEAFKPHIISYNFTHVRFDDTRNHYYHSGFLSPRIAYIKRGNCEIKTDKQLFRLHAGSIWYLPRFYPYSSHWTPDPEVEFYAIEFEADIFGSVYREMQTFDGLPVVDAFENLANSEKGNDEFSALSALYSILSVLKPNLQETKKEIPQSVLLAVEYLTTNYNATFKVSDLAGDCYLSESRFYYLFKKATGFSPVDYKNYLKITHAASDLQQGFCLEEICEKYGFCSPSYFRRLFKKFTGKNPSEFKKVPKIL